MTLLDPSTDEASEAPMRAVKSVPNETEDQTYAPYLKLETAHDSCDQTQFWFREDVHHPEPIYPFETIIPEAIKLGMGQYTTRMLKFPMSNGIDARVHHGRVYFSPIDPPDAQEAAARAPIFERRTTHIFDKFEDYEANWKTKMTQLTETLRALPLPDCPDTEAEARALGGGGLSSGHELCQFYAKLTEGLFQAYQYHFELLNVGYLGLLQFSDVFTSLFPSANPSTVSMMLKNGTLELYEPQRQIGKLADLASDLGIGQSVVDATSLEDITKRAGGAREFSLWTAALEAAREDWFDYSDGIGFSYNDRVWNDHPNLILQKIQTVLLHGDALDTADAPDPETLFERCSALIEDQQDLDRFTAAYERARRVTPYLENHNLYVEHRFQAVFWRRLRELGQVLTDMGWLNRRDDIILLDRWSLGALIFDAASTWALGSEHAEKHRWQKRIEMARTAMSHVQNAPPPPRFLGAIPDTISDPILICLFGITTDAISMADASETETGLIAVGQAASNGKVQGQAWIAKTAADVACAPAGAIIICRSLLPSWTVGLGAVGGVICEVGGMLSHAAIVCREYGKPAIVSVPDVMGLIETGDLIEIDGETGRIRLSDA